MKRDIAVSDRKVKNIVKQIKEFRFFSDAVEMLLAIHDKRYTRYDRYPCRANPGSPISENIEDSQEVFKFLLSLRIDGSPLIEDKSGHIFKGKAKREPQGIKVADTHKKIVRLILFECLLIVGDIYCRHSPHAGVEMTRKEVMADDYAAFSRSCVRRGIKLTEDDMREAKELIRKICEYEHLEGFLRVILELTRYSFILDTSEVSTMLSSPLYDEIRSLDSNRDGRWSNRKDCYESYIGTAINIIHFATSLRLRGIPIINFYDDNAVVNRFGDGIISNSAEICESGHAELLRAVYLFMQDMSDRTSCHLRMGGIGLEKI